MEAFPAAQAYSSDRTPPLDPGHRHQQSRGTPVVASYLSFSSPAIFSTAVADEFLLRMDRVLVTRRTA